MVPVPFVVVVDANVLFPLTLRDTLLRAAAADFYQLRWTKEILDEMERNLVSTGTIPAHKSARLRRTMEEFFPEAMVTGYEPLIAAMQRPSVTFEELLDRLTRSVPELVAAVREYLVTGNAA